jgi:hypothetical protein
MVARSLAAMHTAIYDARAVYCRTALPTRLRLIRKSGGTDAQRIRAISQAAYRVLVDQFPSESAIFDAAMTALGFANSASTDATTPEGVGSLAANAILENAHSEGANQLGTLGASGALYGDYRGYSSSSPPIMVTTAGKPADIAAPDRWQPLGHEDAPHWARSDLSH